jgi:hypothetical protein
VGEQHIEQLGGPLDAPYALAGINPSKKAVKTEVFARSRMSSAAFTQSPTTSRQESMRVVEMPLHLMHDANGERNGHEGKEARKTASLDETR